jgi:hypothetical protein
MTTTTEFYQLAYTFLMTAAILWLWVWSIRGILIIAYSTIHGAKIVARDLWWFTIMVVFVLWRCTCQHLFYGIS